MDELNFTGKIVNGRGTHVELGVPGRSELINATNDWPERLKPGSLNLLVSEFPDVFEMRRLPRSTESLDVAGFEPEFIIPQAAMSNNELKPSKDMPHRGAAQVWQAVLEVEKGSMPCWVLRRFGSGLDKELEMVSDVHLRTTLGLAKDREWPAKVKMFGVWKP